MPYPKKRYLLLAIPLILIGLTTSIGASWFSGETISYNASIRPIINTKCIACHGGVKQSGGFSLLFREDALGPTESGVPAIVPGNAQKSELYRRLIHSDPEQRMPLDHPPLSEGEISLIRKWIDQGAQWEDHWAYLPPDEARTPPTFPASSWPVNGIDAFVLARMEQAGLTPSPQADKAALLRRLSLDLTGLPPSPEETHAFFQDTTEAAYERTVDRLLASPRFGEKWASFWLDLARYADSKGYEKDLNRSIWKYRDWVIRALDEDMPFDQFTIEQLAGDLLPEPTEEQLIATAFHRNTMANDEGGTNDEEFRVAAAIERVGTTWEIWQGTTLACVQCHSHPYDPFRHEDFYRFMAFFNNTADKDIYNEQPRLFTYEDSQRVEVEKILGWIREQAAEKNLRVPGGFLHEEKEQWLYELGYRQVEAEEYQDHSRFIELTSPDQLSVFQIQDSSWIMFEDIDLTGVAGISYHYATPHSGAFVDIYLDSLTGQKINTLELKTTGKWSNWKTARTSLPAVAGKHNLYYYFRVNRDYVSDLIHLDWMRYELAAPRMNDFGPEMRRQLKRLYEVETVSTPIMQELPPSRARTTHLFERGNWLSPGQEVKAGLPASLLPESAAQASDRLEMARWLVSPENPLTARVVVNRFWGQLFGTGLVTTVEDLGTQGDAPSHPELLDWLAVRFRRDLHWSMKALIKELVMSATYRQQSHASHQLIEKDPKNRLLARGPRIRLSSEQMRDQALAVADLLDTTQYGPPVQLERPDIRVRDPYKQAELIGFNPFRRTIYNYWRRIYPSALLLTFDSSSRSICTSRRIRTNTPLQALVLLNDSIFFQAAQALAVYMDTTAAEPVGAISAGYERLMLRAPNPEKMAAFTDLYLAAEDRFCEDAQAMESTVADDYKTAATPRLAALTLVANALLNMDEWITKN